MLTAIGQSNAFSGLCRCMASTNSCRHDLSALSLSSTITTRFRCGWTNPRLLPWVWAVPHTQAEPSHGRATTVRCNGSSQLSDSNRSVITKAVLAKFLNPHQHPITWPNRLLAYLFNNVAI